MAYLKSNLQPYLNEIPLGKRWHGKKLGLIYTKIFEFEFITV